VSGEQVTIASFNTRGVPVTGSYLARRYAAIGAEFDAGDVDVACFQEVLSYWHLRLLAGRMPSFRFVSYRPSVAGPAGGLVAFSRLPVVGTAYRRFGIPPQSPGISRLARYRAGMKGVLVTRLAQPQVCIISTHPLSNRDGDWSAANRFYPLHRAQLDALTQVVLDAQAPAVACGDFNIDRGSTLFGGFLDQTGLSDAFGGGCPATFRAEYLPAGETPHCIDFILTTGGVEAEAATVLFQDKVPLPGGPGYVSDHVGLRARLSVASS
jgi:Endonuclease/Exonuclease/phosphatase family